MSAPAASATSPDQSYIGEAEQRPQLPRPTSAVFPAVRVPRPGRTFAVAPEAMEPGTVFHRYEIERTIGCGNMASVYEARAIDGWQRVALKVLNSDWLESAEARARFSCEGEAASRIAHPHVVRVHEVGVFQRVPYIAMEYFEGESLEAFLCHAGALGVEHAVAIMLPVVAAVVAAHEAEVVHRDIKPANILLAREPDDWSEAVCPKLLDFGISRVFGSGGGSSRPRPRVTDRTQLIGTPGYMAPEQVGNGCEADARSDQYALGATLYECLVGRGPFDDAGSSLFECLRAVREGHFAPPRALRPELPAMLERIVLRAMSRDPDERFPTVMALGQALLGFADLATQVEWEPVFARPTRPDDAAFRGGF